MSSIPVEQMNIFPKNDNDVRIQNPLARQYCLDEVPLYFDSSFPSYNEHLHGKPNPKTLDPTPIVAPPTSWDYWSSSHSVPHAVNKQVYFDNHHSGYRANTIKEHCSQTCKPATEPSFPTSKQTPTNIVEMVRPSIRKDLTDLVYPTPKTPNPSQPVDTELVFPTAKEPTNTPQIEQFQDHVWINEKGSKGDVLTNMYDPEQLIKHHIPSNVPAGEYAKRDHLDEYNKRMYTNIIQPNMYQRVEVAEPIQQNIGITFQQQLQPVKRERVGEDVVFTRMDPRIIRQGDEKMVFPKPVEATNQTVYDPRFTGYGTSYRMYIEEMTGQPRFMYDDIDAVRKPNFIIRSNIDHAPWASSYGSVEPEKEEFNRQRVHEQFLGDTLQHREEFQERYMRKYNTQVAWQRRQAPIHRRNMA